MDEQELEQLNLEIEAMAKPRPEDGEVDSEDGFRKYVRRQLAQFSCISGKSKEKKERDNLEASGRKKASASPRSSTSSQDFQESRTAFITSEARSHGDQHSDIYNFSYPKRGLAVIINNENFAMYSGGEFGDRPGSSYDRAALFRAFTTLGFDVLVYNDLAAAKMVEVLKQAATQYDHTRADCFACAVLTHGDQTWTEREYERLGTRVRQDLLFGVDGRVLATKTAIDCFSDQRCPGLAGKPRLFFLQACRGTQYDDGTTIQVIRPMYTPGIYSRTVPTPTHGGSSVDYPDKGGYQRSVSLSTSVDPPQYHKKNVDSIDAKAETQIQEGGKGEDLNLSTVEKGTGPSGLDEADARWFSVQNVPVSPAPLYKDFLVMYATPPGHYAWRRGTGSWFVQCLSKILCDKLLGSMSLLKALVAVSGHVAMYYQSNTPDERRSHKKKEVPVIETMLVKDIYLARKIRKR